MSGGSVGGVVACAYHNFAGGAALGEFEVDSDGLRSGAAVAAVSARELAGPLGLSANGDQPSHSGLAALEAALNAAGTDAAAFFERQTVLMAGGARDFEDTEDRNGDRFGRLP